MEKIMNILTGYVKLCICGGQKERFLNLCMARGIIIWNLKGSPEEDMSFYTAVRHVFLFKPICQKTGVRIHILEKHGLPFFFVRSKKRKAFFGGILLFCLLLVFLSGRIWTIQISGNLANSTPEIRNFLKTQGISGGIRKSSVSCSGLAAALRERYPETAWVSARIHGTSLMITIKEGSFSEELQKEEAPCSLAATQDGTIVKMITRRGVPLLRPGDTCKKGDILVLGRLDLCNDNQEIFRCEYVHADADIFIKRTLSYYAELPLQYEERVPVEEAEKGLFFKAGSWYLEFGRKTGNGWEWRTEEFPLQLNESLSLPFSFGKIISQKYRSQPISRTETEAKAAAFQILQEYEQKLMEKGVQISANNVKIEIDYQTCISRGTLEIIEKIGEEVPVEEPEQPVLQSERTTENG